MHLTYVSTQYTAHSYFGINYNKVSEGFNIWQGFREIYGAVIYLHPF